MKRIAVAATALMVLAAWTASPAAADPGRAAIVKSYVYIMYDQGSPAQQAAMCKAFRADRASLYKLLYSDLFKKRLFTFRETRQGTYAALTNRC
jgi:hypothetical protein